MSGKLGQIDHRSGVEPVSDIGMSGRYSTAPDGSRIGAPDSDFAEIGRMFARKVRGKKPSLQGRNVSKALKDSREVRDRRSFGHLGDVMGSRTGKINGIPGGFIGRKVAKLNSLKHSN